MAQGTFVNDDTRLNQQAVTGKLIQTASGLLNQILAGENDKFNLGVSYEQGLLIPMQISEPKIALELLFPLKYLIGYW